MRKDRPTDEDIRESLHRLGETPELARSRQLVDFLNYVVEKSLDGEESRLKAYSIATEVFGRGDDFDPQTDSIVRVQARRLRTALDAIYNGDHEGVTVRIFLPIGSYVPRFDWVENADKQSANLNRFEKPTAPSRAIPARRPAWRHWKLAAVVAIVTALAFGLLAWFAWPSAQPFRNLATWTGRPVVIVSEFAPGDADAAYDAGIFQTLLVELLSAFDGLDVRVDSVVMQGTTTQNSEVENQLGIVYRLGGQIALRDTGIDAHVTVTRLSTSEVIWSHGFTQLTAGMTHDEALRMLAILVATNVAAFRGKVQVDARAQLPDWAYSGPDALGYACGMLYRDAIGPSRVIEAAQAQSCFAARLAADGSRLMDKAAVAALDALDIQRMSVPGDELGQTLQSQIEIGADAVRALPASAFAHELYARILWAANDIVGARREFQTALKANPANADLEASLGIMEVLSGNASALFHVERAINRDRWPAGWYFTIRALDALRHGDHSNAIHYALLILPDDAELGLSVLVATAPGARRMDLGDTYIPALLALPQFGRDGIIARLSMRIMDAQILGMLRKGLEAAGIPERYLDHGYQAVEWPP
ncbi:MAG: hypothetical protein KKH72_06475 [Alphaproteobacteria bacterium]|nr:hypothetical protein [Alphaproteobacteria bacterium]